MDTREKIIFIMLLLIIIRVLMILTSVLTTFMTELFINNNNTTEKNHFKRYMNNISPSVYSIKTKIKTNSEQDFTSTYLSLLSAPPYYKSAQLNLYTQQMKVAFNDVNLKNIADTPTEYVMSTGELEMNMPYTLENKIVLNEKSINKLPNHIDNRILETFIHEKLHTIQRLHQKKFNDFYRSRYPFLHDIIPLENLPDNLKTRHMTNPDNNFDLWLYKINGKIYIPILEITEKGLREYAYEYNKTANKVLLRNILKYSKTSQTHPNELFAYEVAAQIMGEKLDTNIYDFLKGLKF